MQNENLVVYSDGELELTMSLDKDTVWLTTTNIASIFNVHRPAIVKHINNIYKTKELDKNLTCSILEQVTKDGKKRKVNFYNLDIIISVGYRVNSVKATKFRRWATTVLHKYITNNYVINNEKLTQQRILSLEDDVKLIKSHIKENTLEIKQGVFYNGQIFEAYKFASDIIKSANKSIVLIDNYIDDSTLILLSKNKKAKIHIYTKSISKQLKLDLKKYSLQYPNKIEVKTSNKFHDRFLLIDDNSLYHIGASLKDLGNKVFAFSKMNVEMISRLLI
ncbi:MAG: Putative DNA-binding protein in cluster with Type I restriction-modification system [uncultured Campylobacterales bacterium]|uniref:DNA-binding protein in cluster with Type I restriction-modification system n=1 Tax=uncultured Campylobacterales bacterium TaxID=352960 RepID=A0A6S6SBQ2_9BACT|nr:MAG: Putative DNA-binding protein in cluster with Type I restriction-modification system [uncultured Campylobacterales bacterium]